MTWVWRNDSFFFTLRNNFIINFSQDAYKCKISSLCLIFDFKCQVPKLYEHFPMRFLFFLLFIVICGKLLFRMHFMELNNNLANANVFFKSCFYVAFLKDCSINQKLPPFLCDVINNNVSFVKCILMLMTFGFILCFFFVCSQTKVFVLFPIINGNNSIICACCLACILCINDILCCRVVCFVNV